MTTTTTYDYDYDHDYDYLRETVEEAEGVDGVVQPDGEADRGGGGATQTLDKHLAVVRR